MAELNVTGFDYVAPVAGSTRNAEKELYFYDLKKRVAYISSGLAEDIHDRRVEFYIN